MKRITVIALLSGFLSLPAVAQDPHAGHAMPTPPPSPPPAASDPHSGHQMPPPADPAHTEHVTPDTDDSMGDAAMELRSPLATLHLRMSSATAPPIGSIAQPQ